MVCRSPAAICGVTAALALLQNKRDIKSRQQIAVIKREKTKFFGFASDL
jgi:hypothetical protein